MALVDHQDLPEGMDPVDDAWAHIEMPGATANALANLTTLVDECKIHIEERDGGHVLRSRFVDPANVSMGEVILTLDDDLDGINRVQLAAEEMTTGILLTWLRSRMKWARVGRGGVETGDTTHLLLEKRKMKTQVERDVIRTSSRSTIDPDAMRQEPEMLDLDLPCKATEVTPDQLYQAVQAARADSDHIRVAGRSNSKAPGDLHLEAEGDVTKEDIIIPEVVTSEQQDGASTLLSLDYLWEMAQSIKRAKMERMTIIWGQEFPVKIKFSHTGLGIEGQFMLAPRIQSDD